MVEFVLITVQGGIEYTAYHPTKRKAQVAYEKAVDNPRITIGKVYDMTGDKPEIIQQFERAAR